MTQRIIFVNRFGYPDHSATSQILSDLAAHLAAEGRDVRVIASRSLYSNPAVRLPRKDRMGGVSIHRVSTLRFGRGTLFGRLLDYASFYPGAMIALLAQARRGDIVVAKTDPPLIGLVVALACRLKGAKMVNWLQDLYPEIAVELGFRVLAGRTGRLLTQLRNRSLRAASVNVVIGERMAARLAAFGLKSTIIANWTDDDSVQPVDASQLRSDWGFAEDDFVVGYSGNLGRAHEADTILDAARRLCHRPDIKFLFVGGGHGLEAVTAARLPNVAVREYQPRERLAQSLCVADVHWISLRPQFEGLVLPSKIYGIAAAARPIIAVCEPTGEIADLVQGYRCGIAVAAGDGDALATALETMSMDRAVVNAMGRRAREMLKGRFSKAASLSRWSQILTELNNSPAA